MELGEWRFSVDREATAAAYSRTPAGCSSTCTCCWCRNFQLVRAHVFPAQFSSLLITTLGIDPAKDAEVYHEGRRAPGLHYYGGWYHFVGELEVTGDFPAVRFGSRLSAYLCEAYAPRLDAFKRLRAVQLEFRVEDVPWVLDEPDPESIASDDD